jgi:hypothetical protein
LSLFLSVRAGSSGIERHRAASSGIERDRALFGLFFPFSGLFFPPLLPVSYGLRPFLDLLTHQLEERGQTWEKKALGKPLDLSRSDEAILASIATETVLPTEIPF